MRELMSYLPENYPDSKETAAFQEALQPEVGLIWAARDSLLRQLDPYTADWGLDYWEDALGLLPGGGMELDVRRRQIVAKLQGRAATTPEVLKTVAETLLGVRVTVVEHFSQYRVELETEAGYRPGGGMDRVRKQLRDIMPAHLDWQVVIPAVVYVPVRLALGPRVSVNAAPPFRGRPLGLKICATPLLEGSFSATTLPAAAQNGGG